MQRDIEWGAAEQLRIFFIGSVDKSQNFGDDDVGGGGDFLIEIKTGENFDEIGILLNRDIVFPCQFDESFSQLSAACSYDPGRILSLEVIAQGHRLFYWWPIYLFFRCHLISSACCRIIQNK